MKALKKTMMAALTAVAFTATANAASIQIRFADLGLNADNLYQYLAVEKGVYEKFGLDIRRTSFLRGGPGLVAAAASGQVDLGDVGVPLLTGLSRGFALKIVGAPAMKGEEFLVVARPNVKDITSLRDQLVGVSSIGGGQDQAIRKILKAHGLAPNSIKLIAYGNAAGGYVALQSGRLAAVVISEPDASRAEMAGVGKLIAKAVDYYGRYEQSYIFASPEFIAAHSDAVRTYFKANHAAIDYATSHPDELVSYAESKLNLPKDVATKIVRDELATWDPSQRVDIDGLFGAVKTLQELGDIDAGWKPDISKITDFRFNGQSEKDAQNEH